jgi:hypothetical protein
MDKASSNPDPIANLDAQPVAQKSGKDAWVTPVVREYDPAEVTKAAPIGIGADLGLYS